MGRRKEEPVEEPVDRLGWMVTGVFADFLLMHTTEIKYMCMLGYTFMHGSKLFKTFSPTAPLSYKFIRMVLQCTGGGILVPIFINAIPVPLSTDAYPIAIFLSFLLHLYVPIVREVMSLSPVLKVAVIILYETLRASVVVKLTAAAGAAIPASEFSFPLFGPIFCGAIAGCGGAFLPLDKGLAPLDKGLAPAMLSALVGAAFFHIFLNTSLSDGVADAKQKAHFVLALYFVLYGIIKDSGIIELFSPKSKEAIKAKKEN